MLSDIARRELKRRLVNLVRFLDRECSDPWQRAELIAECDQITAMLRSTPARPSSPSIQPVAA
jgi:hypothetical protein